VKRYSERVIQFNRMIMDVGGVRRCAVLSVECLFTVQNVLLFTS
jgi:hypothetical protein